MLDIGNNTSNDLEFLKIMIPSYSGKKYYKMEPAVSDGNLITTSGIAPLEFTIQVLKVLDVFKEEALSSWLNIYETNDSKYFFELMNCNK